MNKNGDFRHDDWRRSIWRDGNGSTAGEIDRLLDLALQAGLWACGCLALASMAPAPLVAPLLRELLLIAAFAVSLVGLWNRETFTLERFNRQDVALALLALALVSGLFADPAAVEAFLQSQGVVAAPDS